MLCRERHDVVQTTAKTPRAPRVGGSRDYDVTPCHVTTHTVHRWDAPSADVNQNDARAHWRSVRSHDTILNKQCLASISDVDFCPRNQEIAQLKGRISLAMS